MPDTQWANELPVAITVCDKQRNIVYMNEKSMMTFSKDGGGTLIGQKLDNCHSISSQQKIKQLIESKSSNIYTIKKNNKKKMIVQIPWFSDNEIMGLVEFSFEIPENIPFFDRD